MKVLLALLLFVLSSSPVFAEKLPSLETPYPGVDGNSKGRDISIQAWWVPSFGHEHVDAIIPFGSTVSGDMVVPMRVILHDNPSTLDTVKLMMVDYNQDVITLGEARRLKITCSYDGSKDHECASNYSFTVHTKDYSDGWKEFYLWGAMTTPDDKNFRTSSRVPVEFKNGNRNLGDADSPFKECEHNSILGRGWYDSPISAYADARALCVPLKPVSGILNQKFMGGGSREKHLNIYLSKTHAIPGTGSWKPQPARSGKVLFDKDGSFKNPFSIKIDTRELENGRHTIGIFSTYPKTAISVCDYCTKIQNSLNGAVVYDLYVQN